MPDYGKELILDLHECNPERFTRRFIKSYFKKVCDLTHMQRCKLTWWDDVNTPEGDKQTEPHLVGTSAVQFIMTSNITIHTLDILRVAYVNLFSCKDFDPDIVRDFSANWFQGQVVACTVVRRI